MSDKPKLYPLPAADDPQARELYAELEIDVMARTLWGEARGQGQLGMQAVANVILNRVKTAQRFNGYWWGNSIIEVCHKPYQFSCWNKFDPSYKRLLRVSESNIHFMTALRVARRARLGLLDDVTHGADHYHADYVAPDWAKGRKPTAVIGAHRFYKLIGGK